MFRRTLIFIYLGNFWRMLVDVGRCFSILGAKKSNNLSKITNIRQKCPKIPHNSGLKIEMFGFFKMRMFGNVVALNALPRHDGEKHGVSQKEMERLLPYIPLDEDGQRLRRPQILETKRSSGCGLSNSKR